MNSTAHPDSPDGIAFREMCAEMERLKSENARLKAAVEGARPLVQSSYCVCIPDCIPENCVCGRCKWLTTNPE